MASSMEMDLQTIWRRGMDAMVEDMKRITLESMKAMLAQRQRESVAAGTFVEGPINQLSDDLMAEILCRLPLRFVLRSRCVCKGWLSLTTSPQFLRMLESHHNSLEKDHPVGLLIQGAKPDRDKQFVFCSGVRESRCFGYSLEFLPGNLRQAHGPIVVMGSSDDLLLCCNENRAKKDFFIVNAITREWVALPPALRECNRVVTGLVCDPASIPESKKGGKLRYKVARIPVHREQGTKLDVEIFSSETGKWNEYAIRCEAQYEIKSWRSAAVACNGKLYWLYYRGGKKIVALDPFNPTTKEFVKIKGPKNIFYVDFRANQLGIHRGKLRMCQTNHSDVGLSEPETLHIWELEEGDGGAKWRCIWNVSLGAIAAANPSDGVRKSSYGYGSRQQTWFTLAMHPIDGDIIYFGWSWMNLIISCNLRRRRVKIVCDYNFNKWNLRASGVFPIMMPWFPTPVPASPEL